MTRRRFLPIVALRGAVLMGLSGIVLAGCSKAPEVQSEGAKSQIRGQDRPTRK